MSRGRKNDGPTFVSFYKQVKAAEATHAAAAMGSILKATRDDWKAAAWTMERRHGYNKIGSASTQRDDDILDGVTDADRATRVRAQLIEVRAANKIAFEQGSFQALYALL